MGREARDRFEASIDLKEAAEACEALSWVEWWANNGDRTIRLSEKAYGLYRETNNDVGAALAAMWLATDYEDFQGEFPIVRGLRQRAHRLLAECPLCAEHSRLAILEGDAVVLIEEDTTKARRCAAEAAAVARQCGVPDISGLLRQSRAFRRRMYLSKKYLDLIGIDDVERRGPTHSRRLEVQFRAASRFDE